MINKISQITRRNIFDFIKIEKFSYNGRLEETEFLSRLFDLRALPSTDERYSNLSGDIWQHRVNNPNDWSDDWIYTDDRLNLLNCDDSTFLQFLCETIHPIVRQDTLEVNKLVQIYNENLKNDDFEIIEKSKISGKPLFAGRLKFIGKESLRIKNTEISVKLNAEYVSQQINLMESSIENQSHVAIGIAKELIETCCKKILEERNIEYERTWDLMLLIRKTNKSLKLSPEDIPDDRKASETIKGILRSLTTVVQGIAELRNEYGSGHGKSSKFIGLGSRHAKLAVGAATTLAIFLLETHEIK
ncbi:MAG: abortive infection family protein [Chitinophagaceae bacterium]